MTETIQVDQFVDMPGYGRQPCTVLEVDVPRRFVLHLHRGLDTVLAARARRHRYPSVLGAQRF
jgi:hypothetical protein